MKTPHEAKGVSNLVIAYCRIHCVCSLIFGRVSSFHLAFKISAQTVSDKCCESGEPFVGRLCLRDAFLGPVKVPFDFFGSFHPIREIGASAVEPPLSERLQFKEFTMLGIELSGTGTILVEIRLTQLA